MIKWKRFALLVLVFFVIDVPAACLYDHAVKVFLSSQTIDAPMDAGVVFFGDYDRFSGDLGKDTTRRLQHAVDLYRSGRINHIICVGGARVKKESFGSLKMRDYLIMNGIPNEKILYDMLSYDTKTNWEEALRIIDLNHFETILIISGPYHVYRISKIVYRDNTHYSPSGYRGEGISGVLSAYGRIHYEWIAYALFWILPEEVYLKLLFWFRNVL